MNEILQQLTQGDRRSIGNSEKIVALVLTNPNRFVDLFQGFFTTDVLIRMRTADAVEKISLIHPEYLIPYKSQILNEVTLIDQQEVRWHIAQILPRLPLGNEEKLVAMAILETYLNDPSRIVKTFTMQAMADLALQDHSLCARTISIIERLTQTGSPAMKSRGRKLLTKLRPLIN